MDPCLSSYIELCRPLGLPAAWDWCPPDDRAFQGPSDPDVAWTTLLERHTEAELLASGLAEQADGRLRLHPALSAPDVDLVVLHDTSHQRWNIMTQKGSVRGARAPLFEVLGDDRSQQAFLARREVFLVNTMIEAVVLRSLGLAAAPIADAVPLNQEDLALLDEYYGVERQLSPLERLAELRAQDRCAEQADEGAKRPPPSLKAALEQIPYILPSVDGYMGSGRDESVRLTLIAWDLEGLTAVEPQVVAAFREELLRLKRFRKLKTEAVVDWKATAEQMQQLRFAQERKEITWLQEALCDGIDTADGRVGGSERPARRPLDLSDAVARLAGLRPESGDAANLRRTEAGLKEFERILQERLIEPLLRQAERIADPIQRALYLQFAQLLAPFSTETGVLSRRLLTRVTQPNVVDDDTGKKLTEVLALSKQLLALAKELSCKPAPQSPRARPRLPKTIFPRFAVSDLVHTN